MTPTEIMANGKSLDVLMARRIIAKSLAIEDEEPHKRKWFCTPRQSLMLSNLYQGVIMVINPATLTPMEKDEFIPGINLCGYRLERVTNLPNDVLEFRDSKDRLLGKITGLRIPDEKWFEEQNAKARAEMTAAEVEQVKETLGGGPEAVSEK